MAINVIMKLFILLALVSCSTAKTCAPMPTPLPVPAPEATPGNTGFMQTFIDFFEPRD
jgi:hypothetical protein